MVQFWLDNFTDLFSLDNFLFLSTKEGSNNYIKILNLIAIISIIVGITLAVKNKNPVYFGASVIVMSITILIKTNIVQKFSQVENIDVVSTAFDANIKLTQPVEMLSNRLVVNSILNINKGDIIALEATGKPLETHVVSGVGTANNEQYIILMENISNSYSPGTSVYKVSNASPNIVSPPDGNRSISLAGPRQGPSDPYTLAVQNYPEYTLPDHSRYDWNLENATLVAGTKPTYTYQGPEYGPLGRKNPTIQNPMAVVEIPDYDSAPTFFGAVNVGDFTNGVSNNTIMTDQQEGTLSMRVQDLLFHKGNSQARYTPMPVDTIPNDQEGFAHFCYRNPTNLVNPKYASIFVNDPQKFKLVSRLAKATGTENGGGGGY
jgi:hypothetical protein